MISLSFLDFLLEASIPALDGYISEKSQSILFEVLFWEVIYLLYSAVFSRILRFGISKTDFWKGDVKERSGIFCSNAQDDTILMIVLATHHLIAGLMCYTGARTNNPDAWRHGYLLETGFEVADIVALSIGLYPYALDNIKPDIKVALVFHHLPGILFSGLILNANFHHNEHLQEIAIWLLVGASFSCVNAVFIYNLSLDTQMPLATVAYCLNIAFFVYCRFWVFPIESYLLIKDVQNDPELAGSLAAKCLSFAGGFLGLFGVGVLLDAIPKMWRYIKRTFDGVTPIDYDDVPLSREDRMKRRRSSVMMALDFVDEKNKRRRSSFATIMGMNAIEDLHKLEVEAEGDIDINDLKALNETLNKMQDSFKKDN